MHRSSLRVIFVFLFIISGLFGQNLSIQGVARDNTGQSLPDGTYGFTFRLYVDESGGIADWTEDQNLEVLNGVFSAVLGGESSMAGLDFDGEYWMSLEIDHNGELNPRTKLILSPYAIMAEQDNADNVFPLSGNVGIGVAAPTNILHITNAGSNTRVAIERDNTAYEASILYSSGGTSKFLLGLDNNSNDYSIYAYEKGSTIATFEGSSGYLGLGVSNPGFPLDFGDVGGVKMEMYPYSTTNSAGIFDGWTHNSTLMGSFMDGLYGHGYISIGYGTGSRKFSIGTGSTSTGASAIFKPLFTVETDGDIGFGPNTEYGPVGVEGQQTKMIYGWVNASGVIVEGTGYTSSRSSEGTYLITFTVPFADRPAVTVTGYGNGGIDNWYSVSAVSNSSATIESNDDSPTANYSDQDAEFHFIAVGPR